jgi:hypothetical protein
MVGIGVLICRSRHMSNTKKHETDQAQTFDNNNISVSELIEIHNSPLRHTVDIVDAYSRLICQLNQ